MERDAGTEAQRRELVEAFGACQPELLSDLKREFGPVVKDLRLLGSVLDPKRFTAESDVDVAVIVDGRRRGAVVKLHRALFGGDFLLAIPHRGEPFALDPITMEEKHWETWRKGREAKA